ncbi:hypothetical protein AB832_08125 [Flavobacteriaceae bacterium (ex Bugula neritina AB1)]|nr:hypothetical protein AB832_08125 [Flavobacteriaceae bacterium (ex Bugula neritina AB1)]
MLEIEDILKMHDDAFTRGQVTRQNASDDLVFYNVTQWDDQVLGESQLQYRGQFDILRKAGRHIISELKENPVQVDFEPIGDNYDAADLMDGLYRTTTRHNSSLEAFAVSQQETIVCGFSAWELANEYTGEGQLQEIKRIPLYEGNNTVFFDPNAKLVDKSDADYVSVLQRYSKEGYQKLSEELTGEESTPVSFKWPEESYVFPWISRDQRFYVGKFYHREKVTETIHIFVDPMGTPREVLEDNYDEEEESLIAGGFQYQEEIKRDRYIVTRYIVSGEGILDTSRIPGENLPVVPFYGERAVVEGEEHYEGVTRLAKDPQRLRNFQMSYLADIVSRSPRIKPIFFPEQISGYEYMYEENGADNNYPYLLMNSVDMNGKPLQGAVGTMPEQPIPNALAASIDLSRQAIEDVANPGLPQDIADPDASGKAVLALQNRMDMQSFVYHDNYKMALRRDAEIFASMASEVYDTTRKITLTMQDGTRKTETLMQQTLNPQTMQLQMDNDLTTARFEIYADLGMNYQTQKQQTREELKELINGLPPQDPTRDILLMEYLSMLPGYDMENVRNYAKKKLIAQGIKEPETEEEIAYAQQIMQNQSNQPDPMMIAAQAEMEKAAAEQSNAAVRLYDAETKRMKVNIDAQKAGVDAQSKQIDNVTKIAQALRPEPMYRSA